MEFIWETFDSIFKTVHRQSRRVEELETRVAELERRLQERAAVVVSPQAVKPVETLPAADIPAERAA